jgi:signal transduction histidine kinase
MTLPEAMAKPADGDATEARRELEELVYAVSHDVRAPLRVIDGFSEALLDECRDALTPAGLDYLLTIRSAVARMELLFDGVHRLSRVSQAPVHHADVDVTALAESIAAELSAADPSRSVRFAIERDLGIRSDASLLRTALTQLMQNAWKFTSKQPSATIEVGREPDRSRALFVRDDGAGFDANAAPRLFGPFQRFHPATEFEGLGLGLALVRRIVHRLGGRVRAESAPHRGTTVYMELP